MVRALPIIEWPAPDKQAWLEACRPGLRLQRGGRASHLKPITQADYARRYGYFLDFLDRNSNLNLKTSATSQITPDTVNAYIQELGDRVNSVTLHGSISKLRRAAELLQSDLNLYWLKEIEWNLDCCKRPRSKADRLVFSDRIVAAGLKLMENAGLVGNCTCLARAQSARDGLMIALLALCPIRLKNFAALEIGKSFVRQDKAWWIILPNTETKSHRLDHRAVPDEVTPWIDTYLERFRPTFPPCGDALWPSRYGGALAYNSVQHMVTETTRQTLGIAISPHLFRHCVPVHDHKQGRIADQTRIRPAPAHGPAHDRKTLHPMDKASNHRRYLLVSFPICKTSSKRRRDPDTIEITGNNNAAARTHEP